MFTPSDKYQELKKLNFYPGMPTKNKRYYFVKQSEGSGKNQIMWYNNNGEELRESL